MDLAEMVLHRPRRVSPFYALLTYVGLLVSLSVPIRMFAQTSVQPGKFGVKLSGFENLVGGGASVGAGRGAGGIGFTPSEIAFTSAEFGPESGARLDPNGRRLDALGFGVHAYNTRVSLRVAVENIFPVTRRLVGADFFATMAEQFVASHPPNHGWLSAYGADFADFVAQYRPAAELDYLADVARIEWARVRTANAPDAPGLDLTTLARMDPEALEGLHLNLHVAASLVYSRFPAFEIWRAHQHKGGGDEPLAQIDLAKGPQTTLVSRPAALEVGVALIGLGDAAFLSTLADHSPFEAAYQAAVLEEANCDLACRLGDLVCMRALAAFTA